MKSTTYLQVNHLRLTSIVKITDEGFTACPLKEGLAIEKEIENYCIVIANILCDKNGPYVQSVGPRLQENLCDDEWDTFSDFLVAGFALINAVRGDRDA